MDLQDKQGVARRQHLPAQSGLSFSVEVCAACALAARLQDCRALRAFVNGLTCDALRSLSCMLATLSQAVHLSDLSGSANRDML